MFRNILLCLLLIYGLGSSINSEKSLAVTIYNSNFAMIKDVREISFDKGQSFLYFTDVSENIQTQTVTFKALKNPEKVKVFQQNFEKNLVDKFSILKKYIEKQVQLFVVLGDITKRVKGTLLGYDSGYILKTQYGVQVFENVVGIELPSLPEGFFTVPTLNWKVFSETNLITECQVAYRTTGFSWKSDYSLILNSQETKADIGGWVTIDNNSGKQYLNAKLKLIAGEVNTVNNFPVPRPLRGGKVFKSSLNTPSFAQKSFADFHLYTLSQPVSLNDKSQKQVEFIPKKFGINIKKYNQINVNVGGNSEEKLSASNKIDFTNSNKEGLGIPFPAGIFRVFKEDQSDGSLEFIGEDSIKHTPKDQNISLTTGNAFDIQADKIVSQRFNVGKNGGFSSKQTLTVRNHKEIDSQIRVVLNNYLGDNLRIDWQNPQITLKKQSASRYSWRVLAKPNEVLVFNWRQDYNP